MNPGSHGAGVETSVGRYIRYRTYPTRLCFADPDGSVFHCHHADRVVQGVAACGSVVEGIGRARVEPSFIPDLIDCMNAVPDAASIAAARMTSARLGRPCGGSTGTNVWACLHLVEELRTRGETGSVVTLLCDSGERYRSTLYDDGWLAARGIDLTEAETRLAALFGTVA